MQEQKAAMEQATQGTGVNVSQTADNQLKLDIPSDISFDSGRYDIKSNLRPILDRFATTLNQNPVTTVKIIGHTDSTGSDEINGPLSVNRANATRDYLVDRGVAMNRVSIDGRGSRESIADNNTTAGRAMNRRVEIFVAEPVLRSTAKYRQKTSIGRLSLSTALLRSSKESCFKVAGRCAQGLEAQTLATHAEHEGRWRLAAFGLQIDLQHRFRWQFVRGVGDAGGRGDALEGEGRRGIFAGVDEQRQLAACKSSACSILQLEIFDQLELIGQTFIFEPFFQSTAEFRPDGVVAATGVADGEDDDGRAHERLSE
jgi:hypothetical protein